MAEREQEQLDGSKDAWDLAFEQLGKRRLFRLGLAILVLLYGVAIYAPLVANDRPFRLEAVNYKEYGAALRTLSPVAATIERRLRQSPQEYLEARGEDMPATQPAALALDFEAAEQRRQVLRAALEPGDLARLAPYFDALTEAVELGREGRQEEALVLAAEAKRWARELRKQLVALPLEASAEASAGFSSESPPTGVQLRAQTSYPLLAALSGIDVAFMVLWLWIATWPLWNRWVHRGLLGRSRERLRAWRLRKVALVLASSALAGVGWGSWIGTGSSPFDVAPYKQGLTSGDIVALSPPVWAWLPIGYAETHPEESYRPPTWLASSELDEEGYYVRGPRVPEPDPNTGAMPPSNPVEVRAGELGVNHPWRHLAGTDELGRDFFVRMLWGSRVSLSVGLLSAALLTSLGVLMGALAGYFGGWVDVVIMRCIEVLQSIPALFLILFAMAFVDPQVVPPMVAIVAVIALLRWTGVARLVRGEFLRLREQEFVLAARALGYSHRRTIFRHILPNALSPVIVSAAFAVAAGILTESVISYLGFGIQHPGASWGSLVNVSKSPEHWWVQVFPGLLIFLTVTCYNLVGDALRDALDPQQKIG